MMSGIKSHIKRLKAVIDWLDTLDDDDTFEQIFELKKKIAELEELL